MMNNQSLSSPLSAQDKAKILLPMQTSVFELLTCVVWGCPECYAMQVIYTGIYSG